MKKEIKELLLDQLEYIRICIDDCIERVEEDDDSWCIESNIKDIKDEAQALAKIWDDNVDDLEDEN